MELHPLCLQLRMRIYFGLSMELSPSFCVLQLHLRVYLMIKYGVGTLIKMELPS